MNQQNKLLGIIILLLVFLIMVSGCQNQSKVKGIREKGKFEEEPSITVKLNNGEAKKMKLEEYITGVVAGEMKADWPQNAYGAQAIIARTFALKYLEENKTNVISGSYEFAQEYKPENISDEIKEAVANTRGEVVLYQDNYIKGWFHSSAAGQTTSAKVGLAYEKDEPPYIKSVKSPDQEAPADIKNWKASFSDREIIATLKQMGKNVGQFKKIEIVDKDKTGRVIDFKITGSNRSVEVKAANFRKELDPKKLKSTKIDVLEENNGNYIFEGSGFGHGVGMSQWGAFAMAKDNKSPEDIIEHYFEGIEIARVYD